MEKIRRQNQELQKGIEYLLEEIEKQKQVNSQHENEIGTLLNFNERLLQIIEKEVNNGNGDKNSLLPISERSERQSDLYIPVVNAIKKRLSDAGSQHNVSTHKSLIDRAQYGKSKLTQFNTELHQSEYNYDDYAQAQSTHSVQVKSPPPQFQPQQNQRSFDEKDMVKGQMSREIQELKAFRDKSNKFYDDKIKHVRALGTRLTQFGPKEQLEQISKKLNLSSETQNILKKVVVRSNQ